MAAKQSHWEKKSQSPSHLVILRRPEVEARTGLSRSGIYAGMAAGTFPACVALGKRSVGWDAALVDAWIANRLKNGAAERAARNPVSPPQRRKKAKNTASAEA